MEKIFFLAPDLSSEEVLSEIERMLDFSGDVYLAVSYFTHVAMARKIIKRIKDERSTKIILNSHDIFRPESGSMEIRVSKAVVDIISTIRSDYHKYYDGKIIEIRMLGNAQYSVMHHKFILAGNNVVGFGSMNFTKNSLANNYENFFVTDQIWITEAFVSEFDKLWRIAAPLVIGMEGIRSFRCPECNEDYTIDFESYGAFCTNCNKNFNLTST